MTRARSNRPEACPYVSKGGLKLAFALERFGVSVAGRVAADLGCHKGGFSDCLLQKGVAQVYAVDTGYGILDWKLRNDPRVVVCERTNLLHWRPPTPVDLIAVDAAWTRQELCVPAALRAIRPGGDLLVLVKPQYESSDAPHRAAVLDAAQAARVVEHLAQRLSALVRVLGAAESPLTGSGGNVEYWMHLRPFDPRDGGGRGAP